MLFTDTYKDPTGVNWDALMFSFLHDAHNSNNNTDINALREMVTASGLQNKLIYFTITHRNRARLYSLFVRWQDALTGRNPLLNGKLFVLEGELILYRGHIVDIYVGVFRLPITVTALPMAEVISNALARDPAIDTMAGPYAAGDPDTKGVKTRKIFPIPHPLAGLWLLDE